MTAKRENPGVILLVTHISNGRKICIRKSQGRAMMPKTLNLTSWTGLMQGGEE